MQLNEPFRRVARKVEDLHFVEFYHDLICVSRTPTSLAANPFEGSTKRERDLVLGLDMSYVLFRSPAFRLTRIQAYNRLEPGMTGTSVCWEFVVGMGGHVVVTMAFGLDP